MQDILAGQCHLLLQPSLVLVDYVLQFVIGTAIGKQSVFGIGLCFVRLDNIDRVNQ